jgi:hypothetical protein
MGSSRKNNLDPHQTKNPGGESENYKLVEKEDGKPDPKCHLNPYFHHSSFSLLSITKHLHWTGHMYPASCSHFLKIITRLQTKKQQPHSQKFTTKGYCCPTHPPGYAWV